MTRAVRSVPPHMLRLSPFPIFAFGLLGVLALPHSADAQSPSAKRRPPERPLANKIQRVSSPPAPWIVTVTHKINLEELVKACANEGVRVSAVDGRCEDENSVLNVTTGVILDRQGHVLAQLANLTPDAPAPTITVQTSDQKVFQAEFIGLDGVTGLSVLRVPGLTVAPPETVDIAPDDASEQPIRMVIPTFRPTPNAPVGWTIQPSFNESSARFTGGSPSLRIPLETAISAPAPQEPNCGVALNRENRLVGLIQQDTRNKFRLLPVAVARKALTRIVTAGKSVPRGWLGVDTKDVSALSEPERQRRKIKAPNGVLIGAVLPQSPAEFAGLKDADIITAIEDRPLKSRRELSEVIAERPAGDTLHLTVVRDGERQERRVTLGAREYAGAVIAPDPLAQALKTQVQTLVQKEIALHRQLLNSEKAEDVERLQRDLLALHESTEYAAQQYNQVARQPQVNEAREQSALGVVTSDLTPQLAQYFHAAGGVLVNHVYPDTPAEKAGVRAGDIIILANKAIIQRRLNLLHLLVNGASSTLYVTVVRDKREMHFQIRLSEPGK